MQENCPQSPTTLRAGAVLKSSLLWIGSFAVPGLGMFNEAYYIFSVGNLKPIWSAQYPTCWQTHEVCSPGFLRVLDYSQVAGLFGGMIIMGALVDRMGRRIASITTATGMLAGAVLLTAATGPHPQTIFLFLIIVQAWFGAAVGGEFPVAAATAAERAESDAHLRGKRGQTVALVFSMQAWGNVLNLVILIVFIAALNQGDSPYSPHKLGLVWRMQYGLGIAPIVFMLMYRMFHLKESAVWKEQQQRNKDQYKGGWVEIKCFLSSYGSRLLGTSLCWFAWDFYYYGNKLFQSEFIDVLHPGASLLQSLEYNLLNSSVALVGYYCAAATIDNPWMGRRRMQVMGFAWLFILFLICGAAFSQLTSSPNRLKCFQALYYLSSFWGQFGPNTTTFLLASELFPTQFRGKAHGFSAAVGKLGALAADITLGNVDDRLKFYLSAAAGGIGIIITVLFIPDTTTLDLAEADLRWDATKAGGSGDYTGNAVDSCYLSWYERWRGLGRRNDGRGSTVATM